MRGGWVAYLMRERHVKITVGIGVFVVMAAIYTVSIPNRFNTKYENRRFFDSDGEFITRQFRQGTTFTHNDHLLYHVLATVLYRNAPAIPGLAQDPVPVHKVLSVTAGALGVMFLYFAGLAVGARPVASVATALLAGGCAGWWFFSATIDTYMPSLAASCFALWAALEFLRAPRLRWVLALGVGAALAFLFRTDGFLLAPLGIVLFADRKRFWQNASVLAAVVAVLGFGGYALLARRFYDVPLSKVADWALHGTKRPEAREKIWGVGKNLAWPHFQRVIANHAVYTILMPHVEKTAEVRALRRYVRPRYLGPAVLVLAASGAGFTALGLGARSNGRLSKPDVVIPRGYLLALAALWLLPRIIFYTWWNPYEAFLFAVMSIPAWWLVWISAPARWPSRRWVLGLVWLSAAAIWAHNYVWMIRPFRAL